MNCPKDWKILERVMRSNSQLNIVLLFYSDFVILIEFYNFQKIKILDFFIF